MTGDVFLSNEEYLQQQDTIKARQQRIVQVREQSKKMAAAILNRMKIEADRQYQLTENRILSEIRQHYSRELASVRQHYHQCINDINRQHYVKHAATTCSEKRKQPLKISRNERNVEQESHQQVSKKPAENRKESESNKTAIDSGIAKKTTSVVSKTNCNKLKKPVTEKVTYLPENIIIEPKDTIIEFSKDGRHSSSLSPQRKQPNVKKSVNFLNKENFHADEPHLTSPIKRYPAYAKKPTFLNANRAKVVEQQILDDVLAEHDGNEIYNRLVHDRIRVLEQKEKILRRQSPSAPSLTNSALINKPARFSEYFSNVRVSVTTQKPKEAVNLPQETLKESNRTSIDEIVDDVDRVQRKKNLLVLELSNAETQTDQNMPSDSTSNGEMNATVESKKSVQPCRKSRSPRKIPSLSPIPREEHSGRTVKKGSENHRCKRKLKGNGVTVTVSSNPSVSTNSSDSTQADSYPTVSSSESNVADHHKTVQVVVNVLSSSEFRERKSKSSDRQKNVAYVIPENEIRKVPDWRKLFENEDKMTESSYFSPPDVVLKKQTKVPKSGKAVKVSHEKSPDLGYYIQKLLLMRPESIENLDVSSCSTAIDDAIQLSKPQRSMKLPLYQNSFDERVKKSTKLPYYQNSFDDTLDAVCEFVLKSQCNESSTNDSVDESTELFSRVDDSHSSDSSKLPENVDPIRPETVSKSPRHLSDPSYTNIFRSVEDSHDESDDQIKLPSVEELCKRGFVSEQLLNQNSSDEQETMEEEEFLQQLLSIGQPKVEKAARYLDFKSSHHEIHDAPNVSQRFKDPTDVDAVDHNLKTSTGDLRNENRLLGWMGTTVQRTLQASAINSTSSGDSSDPVRHTYKTLEHLMEEPFDSSETNSLFHKHFTLSPIKVPDIHLTISPVLKDSE